MVIWLILIANWPCFRGPEASGVADGEKLPTSWDLESGSNIAWKMPIEGLAHASPIVWGEQIIVATAVSSQGRAYLKHGLYGSGDADSDRSKHQWLLLSFNLQNGEPLWRRVITEGEPIDKRHIKATYANSTPATDGLHVVVLFGSQGLFCTDMQGTLIWKKIWAAWIWAPMTHPPTNGDLPLPPSSSKTWSSFNVTHKLRISLLLLT